MGADYRRTKYDQPIKNLKDKKNAVKARITKDHPRAKDMHTYLSDNDLPYKTDFLEAYNGKCAYCGVSIDIVPKHGFEIDHFIHEKDKRFGGSKAAAGCMENLVLACSYCNRSKGAIEVPDVAHEYIHPDNENTLSTYRRDEQYYIQIADDRKNDETVQFFYQQIKLGDEIHRIDYLLMSMIGLQRNNIDRTELYSELGKAIDLLRTKRNVLG